MEKFLQFLKQLFLWLNLCSLNQPQETTKEKTISASWYDFSLAIFMLSLSTGYLSLSIVYLRWRMNGYFG